MKKFSFFALLSLLPLFLQSQVCVTRFQGDNFGLEDRFNDISDIEIDRFGNVWFATSDNQSLGGPTNWVGKFDGDSSWSRIDTNLYLPHDIAIDKEDSVWIATKSGLGVYHIITLDGRVLTSDNSNLPDDNVTAVSVDSNNVKWIGFNTGMVAAYSKGVFTFHQEWNNKPVNTIEIASDSTVWVGLGGLPGIVTYKEGLWTTYSEVKDIKTLKTDKWGRVMVASSDSMIIYHDGMISGVAYEETGKTIFGIAVDEAGRIWACTRYNLLLRNKDQFTHYSSNNSAAPGNFSGPIEFDMDNQLWFGYNSDELRTATGYLYRSEVQEAPIISADKPSLVFCYGDSLTLEAAEDMTSYVWPDGSTENSYRLYDAETVEVAVEGDNQCFYYDTVRVDVQKVFEEETVCVVSVDTSQQNIIIWEKTPEVGTESYNIYREMVARDSFEFIGNVVVGDLSTFVDPDVDPRVRSVKYKISSVDTCGNESGQSFYHRTMHLTTNQGKPGEVNLIWTHYEGVNFQTYYIYRGESPETMVKYDSIASNNTSWTDVNAFDTLYYLLVVPLPESCRPTRNVKKGTGPYYHSLSNMDDNKKLLTVGQKKAALEIQSYPNPFTDRTRIEYPDLSGIDYQFRVYNLSGKLVRVINGINGGELFFHRENLEAGYYVFELKGKNLYRGKFVIR